MSTLTEFEPYVDKTIHTFFGKLDEFVAEAKVFDIAIWLQYCKYRSLPVKRENRS
jgi:hypothetical protein